MRARIVVLSIVAVVLLSAAGPASALETKPTNPPTPEDSPSVIEAPPPAPYVEAIRYQGGNGDQTPDPGERLQVFFSLRNPTDGALSGVSGTLTVKGDGVTAIDDAATWPDIAPGAVEEASTPFVIQISDAASRATPCVGGPIAEPAPGTVTPDASDVAVSSDGNASSGSGSAPASSGSTEPTVTISIEQSVVEPAPPAGAEPGSVGSAEPAPGGTVEPPADAPVPFDASVAVHTTTSSFDTDFVSGLACPLAIDANGGTKPGSSTSTGSKVGAPDVQPVAEDASRASSSPSSLPFLLVVLLAAAGALAARYRITP
jgi:hypothetical protein